LNPGTRSNTKGIVDRHPEEVTQIIEMLPDEFAGVNGGSIIICEDGVPKLLRNS
jgi:hypothetical protein